MLSDFSRLRSAIPTMQKPTEGILSRNAGQGLNNRLLKSLASARTISPQDRFQLGECLLNRREVRRIRRQEEELASSGFDGLFDSRPRIEWRDCPGTRFVLGASWEPGSARCRFQRQEHLLGPPAASRRPMPESDNEAIRVKLAPKHSGNFAKGALASRGVSVQRRHIDPGAGFIYDNQVLRR
jgi:hypothetical protein